MRIIFILLVILFPDIILAQTDNLQSDYNVDYLPEIKGGKREYTRFLEYHLNYPKKALENKTEGVVTIKFILSAEGNVSKAAIHSSVSPEIDDEAWRLFKLLEWNGTTKNETPVNVYWYLNVPFKTDQYKQYLKIRKKLRFTTGAVDSSNVVYTTGVKSPELRTHKGNLTAFLQEHLEYPEVARRQNLQGTVLLEFIVETNGYISNLHVVKSVGGGCNEEALRVMGFSTWIPAEKDGKRVRCKMQVPIIFSLQGEVLENNRGSQTTWGQ